MKLVVAISFAVVCIGQVHGGVLPDCTKAPLASNKICDAKLSPRERAAALVAAMQVSEKLANIVSKAQGASRLGLPSYNWWSEALHGIAGAPGVSFEAPFDFATSFPMPLLMSAAFDDDLIEKVGNIIGIEARAFGNNNRSGQDYWTPDVNPFRDPRWGRGSETPGEDTLRIKGYTKRLLRGLEGTGAQRRIIATCKHYAGYDLEEWGGVTRHNFDAKITAQELAEYYMQPFQQCARDSNVGSIMCSYNSVNGVPACASNYLLNTILRDHWNWTESNNYITSDCEAVADVSSNHHYARSNAAGTAECFNNGMDNSCEYSGSSDIPGAWSGKLLNESTVDKALVRLYEGLVRAGYFDGAAAEYASLGRNNINTAEAQSLAFQAAVDGIVLLKNDGTLPLPLKPGSKLAMVGFWADDGSKLQGIYSGKAPYLHTPAYAAKNADYNITVAKAADDAVAAAKKSDYVLYFGGLDVSAAGEGSDRRSIAWSTSQIDLIKKLAVVGKPLIVVQLGDQVDNTPILELAGVNSILWANWPGQDGGPAIMSIISGAKAPAGRLPVTQYPASYTSLAMTDMNLRPGGSNPGRTYRWYPTPVQAFGTGLHYTEFKPAFAANLTAVINIQGLLKACSNQYLDTCPLAPLSVSVTNAGNRTSDYVALVFVASTAGPKPYPIKTLVAYGRLRNVAASQTTTAGLPWTIGSLARHDEQGNTVLYPGTYTLMLDEPARVNTTLTLIGDTVVLDKWPAAPTAKQ
ncbi:glycosyl hydrolase family 3 N terminal domain-containing protein [Thozetella sp. PMI_491]|nr:glycosyl hydrolase family 3 N terminal domain-containing protein [Thozetella sp. PMI_491]